MEEGNLMDRVPILLQRDMQYYEVCTYILYIFYKNNITKLIVINK